MKSEIVKVLFQCLGSILMIFATYLTNVAIQFLQKKKEATIQKIGADKYNMYHTIATNVMLAIEQQYANIGYTGRIKADLFDDEIARLIPDISPKEIAHLREAVVGEFNTHIQESHLLDKAPEFNPEIEL
ncbi:hypothetical protein, partial [Clostridium botulinum]